MRIEPIDFEQHGGKDRFFLHLLRVNHEVNQAIGQPVKNSMVNSRVNFNQVQKKTGPKSEFKSMSIGRYRSQLLSLSNDAMAIYELHLLMVVAHQSF